jgi:hypothetical protein
MSDNRKLYDDVFRRATRSARRMPTKMAKPLATNTAASRAKDRAAAKAKAKVRSRRNVTETMGANTNTRRLLKKMGFTAD